jgi:signal transduction histidine kinase
MTAVLVVVLAVSLALTYGTLADAAHDAAAVRLSRATRQLASSIENSINLRAALQRRVASDSAIHRALHLAERVGPTTRAPNVTSDSAAVLAAARAALARLAATTDTGMPVELWAEDGRPVVRLGRDSLASAGVRELADVSPSASAVGSGVARPDSVHVGAFYESGGRIFFGISLPIYDGTRRIGYIAEQHPVAASPRAEQGLRALIGEDVTARYRNTTGTLWSTLGGTRVTPLVRRDSSSTDTVFRATDSDGTALFATESAIGGTPWGIVLQLPVSTVLARTRATMTRLVLLSLLLVVVSAAVSWVISKRITKPLATLSAAAEALAHGDVTRDVDDGGGDEVGQLARTFNFMRDEITATRTELEAQVEEAQSATEELEIANEQLQHAMEAAELANRAKSDFLAVKSHELRTPLNAIGGYAELISLGVHGPVTDSQRDRTKRLTYTYVACSPALTVHADQDRLHQVVLNLLSNAVKFTPEDGTVTVDCEAYDDAVLVHVRDTGRGIPADRLRTIFEPFVQVERSLSRPHEGIGLGLSISRELARGMGGDLTVESEVGKGSVFTVKVSRTRPPVTGEARIPWATVTPERTPAIHRSV